MKIKSVLLIAAAAVSMNLAAENPNLMKGGDLEKGFVGWTDYTRGTWKSGLVKDAEAKNAYFRMELTNFRKNAKGTRTVGGDCYFGRTGKFVGVEIKPDTEYEVTFKAKSTFPTGVSMQILAWTELTPKPWHPSRKRIAVKKFAANDKEWTTCKMTFRTKPENKSVAVCFYMWGDESQERNFRIQLGNYYVIDDIELREVAAPAAAPAAAK